MPTEYTLTELANLADVTPRTIRYYIAQGLLPSPNATGPGTRYSEEHLERLRAIRKLQAAHLPLSEIRSLLRRGDSGALYAAAGAVAPAAVSEDSASDYIRDVLAGTSLRRPSRPALSAPNLPAPPNLPNRPLPPDPIVPRSHGLDRGTWERISLHPDIEIHVRRPSSRLQNKRVERLISIARQLLEEE